MTAPAGEDDGPETWTVQFAADVFDVPSSVLLRALRSGRLRAHAVQGRLRVRPDEVEDLLAADLVPLHDPPTANAGPIPRLRPTPDASQEDPR